jgi:hypothetical protein
VPNTKYYYDDQLCQDGMGRTCSINICTRSECEIAIETPNRMGYIQDV